MRGGFRFLFFFEKVIFWDTLVTIQSVPFTISYAGLNQSYHINIEGSKYSIQSKKVPEKDIFIEKIPAQKKIGVTALRWQSSEEEELFLPMLEAYPQITTQQNFWQNDFLLRGQGVGGGILFQRKKIRKLVFCRLPSRDNN